MAIYEGYNPVKETSGEFNLAWGTNDRMQFCLCKINLYKEMRNYTEVLEQLKILFDEICTFVSEINKDGKLDPKKEFIEAQRLEKECDIEIRGRCNVLQKNGTVVFQANLKLVNNLREYERYLRAMMFKYKIYTKTKDNTLAAARTG